MDHAEKASCAGFDDVIRMIGGKWKLKILHKLIYGGTTRFNQLRKSIPGLSQTMLTKQLKEMEKDGLVKRTVYPEIPPKVEYSPTGKTMALLEMFESMYQWAVKHAD